MLPDKKVLCIDTTAAHCAAALISGDAVLSSISEPMQKGHAEHLFSIIDRVLVNASIAMSEVAQISVATGPGNFTGIRIGVAAARGLSLSLGVPAIGVSTLSALAYGLNGRVLAICDARAEQLYLQVFEGGAPKTQPEMCGMCEISTKIGRADACVGFQADETAMELGAERFNTDMPLPEVFGWVALAGESDQSSRPAPLYIRGADAALPNEPPPQIVP